MAESENVTTMVKNKKSEEYFVFGLKVFLGSVFTGESLHSERPSGLRGVSLYSLRGRRLLS